MKPLINKIARHCVEAGIVEETDLEWFIYGLEKRTITIIATVIFLLIAIYFSNLITAVTYLGSFYFLRVRTNGYHAKKFSHCLLLSAFIELVFLLFVLPLLTAPIIYVLNITSFFVIFLFAPYNHPNMHLNQKEISVCRTSARMRISLLTVLATIFFSLGIEDGTKGITLGNTMTAVLLIIANIEKGEKHYEEDSK